MNLPSCFDDGGQIAWDATSLTLFSECPRKYFYRQVCGWNRKGKNPHLFFGEIYADALNTYYKSTLSDMTHDESLIVAVKLALERTWINGKPWESDHRFKNRHNLIRTIIWYVDNFRDVAVEILRMPDGKPATEQSFRFELDGEDSPLWCGHMDQIVKYGGLTWVMDQKTTGGSLGPHYFRQWELSGQMSGYAFAGKVVFNMPVAGVIIDAVQIAVGFSRFERAFTSRTEDQLEEWHEETIRAISRARQAFQERRFDRNTTACNNYGGCPYISVCSHERHVRDRYLESDFDKEHWNPLEVR